VNATANILFACLCCPKLLHPGSVESAKPVSVAVVHLQRPLSQSNESDRGQRGVFKGVMGVMRTGGGTAAISPANVACHTDPNQSKPTHNSQNEPNNRTDNWELENRTKTTTARTTKLYPTRRTTRSVWNAQLKLRFMWPSKIPCICT